MLHHTLPDVVGLPALPAAEVEAVGRARHVGIRGHADLGVLLPAVAAAPAGDVERDRNEVTHFDEPHVPADFDDLAGVLVPQIIPVGAGNRPR